MKVLIFSLIGWMLTLSTSGAITLDRDKLKDPQIIGGVYNSKGKFFDSGVRCIVIDEKKNVTTIFNNLSEVDYNENTTSLEINREFGFGFGFSLEPPSGDEYGMELDWLRTLTTSNIDALVKYETTVFVGSEILSGSSKLTEEALKLAIEDPERFDELCGDSFVTRVNKGAIGEVDIKIKADGFAESSEFNADLSLGFLDLGTFEAGLSKLQEKTDIKFKIIISGKQEGGFTASINSIFGAGIESCTTDDLSGCKKIITDVTKYFSGDFIKQFEPYYRDDSGSGVIPLPVTAAPLSYETVSYCKLSTPPPHFNCKKEVESTNEFEALKNKKQEFMDEITRLKSFANNLGRVLAPDYFKLMQIYTKRINTNLKMISASKTNCLRDKWSCKGEVEGLLGSLYPLQSDITDAIEKDDRIEFCFKSGKKVDISGFSVRTLNGDLKHKIYTSYSKPLVDDWDCYMFKAPELIEEEFDGLEISVRTKGEDLDKCKMRIKKKTSSWADWNLQKVKVRHFRSGHQKFFDGKNFKQKSKCKLDKDSRTFLKLESLKPLR